MSKEEKQQDRFAEEFDAAEREGLTQELIPKQYKMTEPGSSVTGLLLVVEPCQGKEQGKYMRYIMETAKGMISVVCGAQVDAILGDGKNVGKIVRLTYLGKEKLSTGRTMNKWDVRVKR